MFDFDSQWMCVTLNAGTQFGQEREKWSTDWFETQLRSDWFREQDPSIRPFQPASPKMYLASSEEFTKQLRAMVDDWIATGIHADGSESPFERNMAGCGRLARGAQFRISEGPSPFGTIPAGAGLKLVPMLGPLKPVDGPDDPISAARSEADRIFVFFLLGKDIISLCKCRGCGKYFTIEVPRAVYKRGTRHPKCSRGETAQAITEARRAEEKRELLSIAAAAFREWPAKRRRKSLKDWIVDEVNKKTGTQRTTKWVTTNFEAIKQAAI